MRKPFVAEILFEEHDGEIHAYSDHIPGLNICGSDRDDVCQDVLEAIKFLYKEVKGMVVSVEWASVPPLAKEEVHSGLPKMEHVVMRQAIV